MVLVQFALTAFMGSYAFASVANICEGRLVIYGPAIKATVDKSNMEKLGDLFELNAEQKHNVLVYAEFYLRTLDARARGRPLSQLRAPYITAQGFKLIETVEHMKQAWPGLEDRIAVQFDNVAVKLKRDIESLESDLRGSKSQDAIGRKLREITEVLRRISRRDFKVPINSPEKSLFEMKQELVKLMIRLDGAKTSLKVMAENSLATLTQIESILQRSLDQEGDVLTYQTLAECELALGVLDGFATRHFDINPRVDQPSETSLRQVHGLSYAKIQENVAKYAAGESRELGGDITRIVKRADDLLRDDGRVLLPAIEKISKKELLTLAFLPIHPLRSDRERDWISDLDPEPLDGSVALSHDLEDRRYELGYSSRLLHEKDSAKWIQGINSAFNNWYLLAGGFPSENLTLARTPDSSEPLIRALLYSARYLGRDGEDKVEWENSTLLMQNFFRGFMFWDDSTRYLLDPNQMEFLASHGAEYFADLNLEESPSEASVGAALDQIIARIARAPDLDLSADPHLRALLAKFPSSAASAKILVLRAQDSYTDSPNIAPSGF